MHSNDELKSSTRYFEQPDPIAFPRTFRQNLQPGRGEHLRRRRQRPFQPGRQHIPHSDTKCTRLWDIDFKGLSLLGPVPGADMADWPFEYSDIAPYYDEIQDLIGVQGDVGSIPGRRAAASAARKAVPDAARGAAALVHAPCRGGEARRAAPLLFPPMAADSVEYNGNPVCNNCGFCSGYGCPVSAKPVNLIALRRALQTGRTNLRPLTQVLKVNFTGRRGHRCHVCRPDRPAGRRHRRHRRAGPAPRS